MNKSNHRQSRTNPILVLVSCLLTGLMLMGLMLSGHSGTTASIAVPAVENITLTYERNLTNQISSSLEGLIAIKRTYILNDSDMVAPKPNPDCFGQAQSAAQMQEVLDAASEVLDGQTTLFTVQTPIKEGSVIHYYLDETIFAVTWKQVVDDGVYTFSEVKIAHPSQFRRFLSEGMYNSGILHTATEMSESVNAVVASSADYYAYRYIGIVVNNGVAYQERGHMLDTCFVDQNGDLLFVYAGEITDKQVLQQYVDDNNVRFSICFGPVMIRDGEYCVPNDYNSGEINDKYARAALCQMDSLHYVVVTANNEKPNYEVPTVGQFGRRLHEMGIPTAYALDGGQTATIVMNNQLINTVSYGAQREISDIIYFATALPENEVNQ